jgi:hypothetical protein
LHPRCAGRYDKEIRAGAHKKLCVTLQERKDHDLAGIGVALDMQRKRRHVADYNLSHTIGKTKAESIAATNADKRLWEKP